MWWLFPPGSEPRDRHGELLFDVRDDAGAVKILQEEGEVIFVPSGWHHQVMNVDFVSWAGREAEGGSDSSVSPSITTFLLRLRCQRCTMLLECLRRGARRVLRTSRRISSCDLGIRGKMVCRCGRSSGLLKLTGCWHAMLAGDGRASGAASETTLNGHRLSRV